MNVINQVKWLRRRAAGSVHCPKCGAKEGERCRSDVASGASGSVYPPAWHHKSRMKVLDQTMSREA